MHKFFHQAELFFFKYRFSCFSQSEIVSCLRPLKKYYLLLDKSRSSLLSPEERNVKEIIECLVAQFTWKQLVEFYLQGGDDKYIQLPFFHVPEMVAKRNVVLSQGKAFVPCTELDVVLAILFEVMLLHGMEVANARWIDVKEDVRLHPLAHKLKVSVWFLCHFLSLLINWNSSAQNIFSHFVFFLCFRLLLNQNTPGTWVLGIQVSGMDAISNKCQSSS